MLKHVAIIGSGAWGNALAAVIRPRAVVEMVERDTLPSVTPQLIILAMPAQQTRAVVTQLAQAGLTAPLVIAAKGLENTTGLLLSEVIAQINSAWPVLVLSGPNFASEIAAGLPAAAVLAGADDGLLDTVADLFHQTMFRLYTSHDSVGVQFCGALKNVIAIAAGMVEGLGLGHNARAAIITRGMAEINRLALANGAEAATLMGLAGMGDLLLTCTSTQSRNYRYGVTLAQGKAPSSDDLVEGVATITAALRRAEQAGVAMPITSVLAAVLAGTLAVKDVPAQLLKRPRKHELH